MRQTALVGLSLILFILVPGCAAGGNADAGGSGRDGGLADSGSMDGGPRDGGRDAGATDSGNTDAGAPADSGADAGGGTDAGTDAGGGGTDAGPPVDAGPAPIPSDTCTGAPDVTMGGTFTGTTVGATDDFSPPTSCVAGGLASGRDVVYLVNPSTPTDYEVTVTPVGSFDPMLYAIAAPCDFSADCLDATVFNGAGDPETISFSVGAGETAFIVVDGEVVTSGEFTITITRP